MKSTKGITLPTYSSTTVGTDVQSFQNISIYSTKNNHRINLNNFNLQYLQLKN